MSAADQTEPLIQQDIEFDPAGGAALFRPTSVLAYPESGGIDTQQGTIAFWLRKEKDFNETDGRALFELRTPTWENRLEMGLGPTSVRFLMTTSDGVEQGVLGTAKWEDSEWHHLTITWGEALMSLYIDGAAVNQRTYDGSVDLPASTPLYIASTSAGPRPRTGTISMTGFSVFQQALGPDEIGSILSETAPSS